MSSLEDDDLWKARNLDLIGRYREADDLRRRWCERNKFMCPVCGTESYPGFHDTAECAARLVAPIMEE